MLVGGMWCCGVHKNAGEWESLRLSSKLKRHPGPFLLFPLFMSLWTITHWPSLCCFHFLPRTNIHVLWVLHRKYIRSQWGGERQTHGRKEVEALANLDKTSSNYVTDCVTDTDFLPQVFLHAQNELPQVRDLGFAIAPGLHALVGIQRNDVRIFSSWGNLTCLSSLSIRLWSQFSSTLFTQLADPEVLPRPPKNWNHP